MSIETKCDICGECAHDMSDDELTMYKWKVYTITKRECLGGDVLQDVMPMRIHICPECGGNRHTGNIRNAAIIGMKQKGKS